MSENIRGARLAWKAHTGHYQQPWTPAVSHGRRGGGRGVPPGQGTRWGGAGGGRAGQVRRGTATLVTLRRVFVGRARGGAGRGRAAAVSCLGEVRVALDTARGTRFCAFLSLSSLSSSAHLSSSIFHPSLSLVLPQRAGERRWGGCRGAGRSAAQLHGKGSARCRGLFPLPAADAVAPAWPP